jgi:ABC-type phosphate transport system substrate-binding protein
MCALHKLFFAALVLPALAWADIAVIVNIANPVRQLSQQQVADLYLGRSRVFPNGEYALVFDLPRDASLRGQFFLQVASLSPQQVNAYWSRLMFTGQVLPPQAMPDERTVLDLVRRNPGALGYVNAALADTTVRVVLVLKN